jgi:hypothetical protein
MYNKGVYNMNSKIIKLFLSLIVGVVFLTGGTLAEEGDGKNNSNRFNKPTADPIRAFMNINFISTIIKNDGISDINIGEDASGLIYPKGSGKTAIYTSGFLWGGIVNDPDELDPHIGGTVYRTGLQPGWIDGAGNVITEDPRVRIYRVRPDAYSPGVDVSEEAQDEAKSNSEVLAQYQLDWDQWPADLGAPFFDGDGDGTYNPDPSTGDIPGVPGADQTIWYVTNDQEEARTNFMYGTDPMGIEMQATFWAYRQTGALGNMFFRRYLIINKTDVLNLPGGPRTFDSMYVSMWSDPDVGDAGDDFAGCDTVLSMTYAYNGAANDAVYGTLPPPAAGFDFFQGPLVDGVAGQDLNKNGVDDADDFGIFKNQVVGPGKINLPMTAAYYFINDDPTLTDPVQQSYPEGAVRFYRFLKGTIGLTGAPFVDPNTGEPSTFTLPGDPVTRSGWIDGQQFAPGDRRIGAASGPFVMAPGDTQEVVVAEIIAGAVPGVDRLSAVALMKFYDQQAQIAYDNFFDLPTPPPSPSITAGRFDENTSTWYAYDGEIILDWSKDFEKVQATESSSAKGYSFQGYNVYQLPSASASITEGIRVATFDLIDGVGKIDDLVFDPITGSVVRLPVQFGNDTGIKRFISIKNDAINQRPLINGIRYYFGVTAYNYNPDPLAVPNNLENPVRILTIIPQSNDPGVSLGDPNGSDVTVEHEGTADGGPTVTIVDPLAITGNDYEVFFTEEAQIRNANGDWVPAGTVLRKPDGVHYDPDDLTGSSILVAPIYPPNPGSPIEMHCTFDYVSSDGNWCDGIELDIEAGITIVDFPTIHAGGGDVEPVITGDPTTGYHIELGFIDPDSLTTNGVFHGGEEWVIYVELFEPPKNVDWVIWDDGWSGTAINAVGTTVIEEIGFAERVADHWNLKDLATGENVLEKQTVVNGTDLWPPRDDSPTNFGIDAAPIVDGFQINLNVGYAAPITISANNEPTVNGEAVFGFSAGNVWWTSDNFTVCDFTRFGYPDGFASTSFPLYGGAGGTTDLNMLQKDLEFRFTGVMADTVINGDTIKITQSGGSIATIFGASGYNLADHPLNPTGAEESFTVRVPFEVWNVDDDEQLNFAFWDREGDPTEPGFAAWNDDERVYTWIINTPYTTDVIDVTSQEVADNATWNVVWYLSTHTTGDVVNIYYDNPIVKGTDIYTFSTTAAAYSSSLAKDQVGEINVFPNPYYGINTEELNKYNRFVTFTHLPVQAKVRIFNLAGVLVRTIDKEDETQFLRWDLANEDGLPVASGLYIAYIELPELGTTKILKLAIVQEQQVLDRF